MSSKDEGLTAFLRDRLRPGMTVVDVGANVGAHTLLAADLVGESGLVIAFEPAPDTAAQLASATSRFPQVRVLQSAVADRVGTARLHLDRERTTSHSLAAANTGAAAASVTVPVVTLDSALHGVTRFDLVKIDAQGADGLVLQGGRRMLKRFRPIIVVEFWPQGLRNLGTDPAALLRSLETIGYEVHKLTWKGVLKPSDRVYGFIERATRWNSMNVVAMPKRPRALSPEP